MFSGKFWTTGALTLGLVAYGLPAMAATHAVVIQSGAATVNRTDVYQPAAPTRLITVEKGVTLPQGQSRFGANLELGGLGVGSSGMGLGGGVNLRADTGLSPGLEGGISVTGLGASGASNLLGNLDLDGKLALGTFSIGSIPVHAAGMADLGAFAAGGGIGSANVGLGIPMTAALGSRVNVTVAPGLGFGFAAGGLLPGGAAPTVRSGGLQPTLGLGLDALLTNKLTAMVDGRLGNTMGLGNAADIGLRYGFTDNFAADLFLGYQNSPLTSVSAGALGIGGYYAW